MPKLDNIDWIPLTGTLFIIIGAPIGVVTAFTTVVFTNTGIDFGFLCLVIPLLILSWFLSIYGVMASNFYSLPVEESPYLSRVTRFLLYAFSFLTIIPLFVAGLLELLSTGKSSLFTTIQNILSHLPLFSIEYNPPEKSTEQRIREWEEEQQDWIDDASRWHGLSLAERRDLERSVNYYDNERDIRRKASYYDED